MTRHEISRWERGERIPDVWLSALSEALDVPPQTIERAAAHARGEDFSPEAPSSAEALSYFLPEDVELGPLASSTGRRVGTSTAAALADRAHGLRLGDDVIASDAGQHDEAARAYRLGISAAREAGDLALVGHLAGSLAYQLTNTGHEEDGLSLARAALKEAGPDAPPKARALYLDRVAWANTKAGNAQSAVRALAQAHEAMDEEGSRELALYLSWLAVALVDANEPEEAASTARGMLDLSARFPSDRTAKRGRVVLTKLEPYRDVPEVREVLDTFAD